MESHEKRSARVTLSACIMTKNGAARLPTLVAQLRDFVDEVVIGVDAASADDTYDVARAWADVAYRFKLTKHTAPARELVFDYATSDWIFSIDDDELLEDGSGDAILKAIRTPDITHVCVARKLIVSLDPPRYVHAPGWYPDWQLRLFRNDRRLVHKPSISHSGYWVSGPGNFEASAILLHMERGAKDVKVRAEKARHYRELGSSLSLDSEPLHGESEHRAVTLPRIVCRNSRTSPLPETPVLDLPAASPLGWRAEIEALDVPTRAAPGETLLITLVARNTGSWSWMPETGGRVRLRLGNHSADSRGRIIEFDRDRIQIPKRVDPGESTSFVVSFTAPARSGSYIFVWDMVSEGECWFADNGGSKFTHPLVVERKWRFWP